MGGTLELLGCEGRFDPDPNKINPLPAPAVVPHLLTLLMHLTNVQHLVTVRSVDERRPFNGRISCGHLSTGFASGAELGEPDQPAEWLLSRYPEIEHETGRPAVQISVSRPSGRSTRGCPDIRELRT